jgi:protein arginine kinase activator
MVDGGLAPIYREDVRALLRVPMHQCQVCKQNPATVHVTEIKQEVNAPVPGEPGRADGAGQSGEPSAQPGEPSASTAASAGASDATPPQIQEQHFCEPCAHAMKLPYGAGKNSVQDILKLIKAAHPPRARTPGGLACPDCGITLVEFRQRGRLGCPKDYEVFGAQLRDLLERIHGSSQHVGRAPSVDDAAVKRMQRITELRAALDVAIRDEAYEAAAKLRDELRTLQNS